MSKEMREVLRCLSSSSERSVDLKLGQLCRILSYLHRLSQISRLVNIITCLMLQSLRLFSSRFTLPISVHQRICRRNLSDYAAKYSEKLGKVADR